MSDLPPTAPAPSPAYASAPGPVPGRTLGIVALVSAFFIQLLAIILGFVALSQSRKAGVKNTPALVGIILGFVFGIVWILIIAGLIAGGAALLGQCAELGSGVHEIDGVTYTCS